MWLNNIGHGRREVADAVHAQICKLGYAPDGSVHPTTLRLAARVAALAPDPASRVFFISGGSEGSRDRDEDGEEVPSQPW